jgi:hypothetical protein
LPHPGDYNGDERVDAADYIVWRKTLGSSGFFLPADGNADNQINALDLDVWRAHFGETAGGGAGSTPRQSPSVPESQSVVLLAIGGLLWRVFVVRETARGGLDQQA